MNSRQIATMVGLCALTSLVFPLSALLAPGVLAQESDTVYHSERFELGDGVDPAVPGVGDIDGSLLQLGPDWSDLFNPDGTAVDEVDAAGNPGSDGIPDYRQSYGGQWAVFTSDDVSLGSGFESTALYPDGRVYNATASADHDLGNAYFYSTLGPSGRQYLYAGVERLGGGDSNLELEFNQAHIRLGRGGYGRGEPWQLVGDRTDGDLLVRLVFADGGVRVIEASTWSGGAWTPVPGTTISSEGCNAAETLCAICNADVIDGGPWPNFDTVGDPEQIDRNRFVEVGLDVSALLGATTEFTTVRMRTPEDTAFGYFREGN